MLLFHCTNSIAYCTIDVIILLHYREKGAFFCTLLTFLLFSMGVKDLWQLVSPVGRRVSLESLEGKTLAIDARFSSPDTLLIR